MEKNLNINFIDNGSDKAILKSMAIDEHHEYDKECLKNTLNSVEDLEKSMRDKSKLVQVERQISGKNGTFTRKYWVSPDQVKKTDIVVGSQQQISEENFPKGSKLYYKGQEATVVRVGREFSGGGMGIVVNFKSGGTGTISKNDLKNVTKEAPKQQQAVSDKKDESQLGKEGDSPKRSENIPSKFNGRSVSDLVSSMEKYGFTIDSADRHSPQKYVTLYKDNKEYTATFNKYNDGSVEILNIKESKASSDLTPVQKDCLDKISKMFVPEDVKKYLEYGVKKRHLVLVSKDGKYKTAKDWDEADYAKHNGWKVEGSLIDRIKSGSIGSIVSGRYDLSQMSESALKDRMKQVTDRISKLSNDIKNNGKSRGQLNSVATDSQKKEYDELVAENGNLMIELGNRKKNTTDKKVVTKDDAKKSVQDYLKKNSGDKAKTIADFKSMGITWEEKEHPAINWMRANMAAQKFFMNQK